MEMIKLCEEIQSMFSKRWTLDGNSPEFVRLPIQTTVKKPPKTSIRHGTREGAIV